MKRTISLLLALLMLLSLAACGQETPQQTTVPDSTEGTPAPVETTQDTQPAETEPQEAFSLVVGDAAIIPGTPFDMSILPEPSSTYTVPSCALDGTDNVYNYDTFEVTAYDEGNGPIVYSIYFIDPNLPTTEGLYLGDDLARVTELYGEDYTLNGTELTYQKGNTLLILILQDEYVISMEYRMA